MTYYSAENKTKSNIFEKLFEMEQKRLDLIEDIL